VHEQVMTDTARYADVLLPATTVFEQAELHKSYGHYFLQYSDAIIPPVGESLSNPEVFARLSRAMGFAEAECTASADDLLHDAVDVADQKLGGIGIAQFKRDKIAAVRFGDTGELIQFGSDFPTTPSKRAELSPAEFGPITYRPLHPEHPLMLISPAS